MPPPPGRQLPGAASWGHNSPRGYSNLGGCLWMHTSWMVSTLELQLSLLLTLSSRFPLFHCFLRCCLTTWLSRRERVAFPGRAAASVVARMKSGSQQDRANRDNDRDRD